MSILLLDNYDSFTYNLLHSVEELTEEKVSVRRNDEIALEEVEQFNKIILSPGPGIPDEANILKPLIKEYYSTKKILGVCLGHQAITEVFGGKILNMKKTYHGVATPIKIIKQDVIYNNLPKQIEVGRYHSWISNKETLPKELEITAETLEGEIMSIRHTEYQISGIQYHPESILTPQGLQILSNWLNS